MTLAATILAVMLSLPAPRAMPGHNETADQRRDRYASIAADVASVAEDAESAALLLAVAYHESGFARDVDIGPCYRGPGWERRCDSGRAVCLTQLQLPRAERARAVADRRVCLTLGLAAARRSLATCRHLAPELRLAGLSGSCSRGWAGARRMHSLRRRMASGLAEAGT